jgi:hypothetical protein
MLRAGEGFMKDLDVKDDERPAVIFVKWLITQEFWKIVVLAVLLFATFIAMKSLLAHL